MRQLVISKSITQREYRSLDKYFNEIDKIGLITLGEEAMLARKIRDGDKQALDRLTITNLRFVISVAKQYQNQGLTLGDLINEGNMGLIAAAKRYDETKGFKFISYAVWWIRQAINASIAAHARMVRVPYNQLILLNKIHSTFSKLEQLNGRKPSTEEVAECLQQPVGKVFELLSRSNISISLHEQFGHDHEHSLLDVLQSNTPGADSLVDETIKEEIQYSLNILARREREIVILFFGLGQLPPQTMEQIGKKFNVTPEYARRLKDKALTQLRNSSKAPGLRSCLG